MSNHASRSIVRAYEWQTDADGLLERGRAARAAQLERRLNPPPRPHEHAGERRRSSTNPWLKVLRLLTGSVR